MSNISTYVIPLIVALVAVFLTFSPKCSADDFLSGARSAISLTFKLIPSLILLMVGVSMFTASGASELLCRMFRPLTDALNIPSEILPVILMRPISGSGTNALATELFTTHGPDSFAGRCASVFMGATDTIFYTFAVYFSAVGIKRSRHAVLCGILTSLFAAVCACAITRIFFY